jgi:hypothetical protein
VNNPHQCNGPPASQLDDSRSSGGDETPSAFVRAVWTLDTETSERNFLRRRGTTCSIGISIQIRNKRTNVKQSPHQKQQLLLLPNQKHQ